MRFANIAQRERQNKTLLATKTFTTTPGYADLTYSSVKCRTYRADCQFRKYSGRWGSFLYRETTQRFVTFSRSRTKALLHLGSHIRAAQSREAASVSNISSTVGTGNTEFGNWFRSTSQWGASSQGRAKKGMNAQNISVKQHPKPLIAPSRALSSRTLSGLERRWKKHFIDISNL